MIRTHFETRAELERQMDQSRQLRAETLGGASWILRALAGAVAVIGRMLLRTTTHRPRSA